MRALVWGPRSALPRWDRVSSRPGAACRKHDPGLSLTSSVSRLYFPLLSIQKCHWIVFFVVTHQSSLYVTPLPLPHQGETGVGAGGARTPCVHFCV